MTLIGNHFEPPMYHFNDFVNFGNHFGPPRDKIWGNHFLEMLKSHKNELSGVENGWVGTKIIIVALLV